MLVLEHLGVLPLELLQPNDAATLLKGGGLSLKSCMGR